MIELLVLLKLDRVRDRDSVSKFAAYLASIRTRRHVEVTDATRPHVKLSQQTLAWTEEVPSRVCKHWATPILFHCSDDESDMSSFTIQPCPELLSINHACHATNARHLFFVVAI
jgi:hypothetical protein